MTTTTNNNDGAARPDKLRVLTTVLHRYNFDLTNAEQAKQWRELANKLHASGVKHFHAWGDVNGPASLPDGATESTETVVLDLAYIFNDQWNSVYASDDPRRSGKCDGERLHDWYQYYEIRGLKRARGHYLEITPAMQQIRRDTLTCGYCGKHYGPLHAKAPSNGFCDACLDSPYLKETELKLLRLVSLADKRDYNDDTLPEGFRALYVERQTVGNNSRAVARREKQKADVLKEFQDKLDSVTKAEGDAVIERDGKLWLHARGVDLENVIYYTHSRRFGFFWRSKYSGGVSASVEQAMRELLEGKNGGEKFPYPYAFEKAST